MRTKLVFVSSITLTLIIVAANVAVAAHPASGYQPLDAQRNYKSGLPASYSYGEIIFIDTDQKPPYDTLSDLEKYLFAGVKNSSYGTPLPPWYQSIYNVAAKYYEQFGYLPGILSDTEIRKISGWESVSDSQLELCRNPLTGAWPRLDATSPSPGDLLLHPMTDAEMRYFANQIPSLQSMWFDGIEQDMDSVANGTDPDNAWTVSAHLLYRPFYIRVYGSAGTLATIFNFVTERN